MRLLVPGAARGQLRLVGLEGGRWFDISRGPLPAQVTGAIHFDRMVEELGLLSKVVTQMVLGRSLSTICSVGRRRRSHPVWKELSQRKWD